jgi:hypothetical protein
MRGKRQTIARGKAERLRWSDENARSIIACKFLGLGLDDNDWKAVLFSILREQNWDEPEPTPWLEETD